jgi:hypothetical protein
VKGLLKESKVREDSNININERSLFPEGIRALCFDVNDYGFLAILREKMWRSFLLKGVVVGRRDHH